jgi:hypothetical protein
MRKRLAANWLALALAVGLVRFAYGSKIESPPPTDEPVVTNHQITLNGRVLKYTARAELHDRGFRPQEASA